MAKRSGARRRPERTDYGIDSGIWTILGLVPVDCTRKTVRLENGAGVFPEMVRQQNVRAQAPLAFFADARGPRVPVANTVPLGYEMPRPQRNAPPEVSPSGAAPGDELSRQHLGFSVGTDYYNTGKMGT